MYCMNCGVKLGQGEEKCPLCGLPAYHPNLKRSPGPSLYPAEWTAPEAERSGPEILADGVLPGGAGRLPAD